MLDLKNTKIILASKSPRRCELMKQAGFEFEIISSDIKENSNKTQPDLLVQDLSNQKATDVLDKMLKFVDLSLDASAGLSLMVIGADTVVTQNNKIMGKPKDKDDASRMISSLQNATHQVYTGVTVILYDFDTQKRISTSFSDCTDVTLYPMTDSEINSYIATSDCYDKAGSYGIQGEFAIYIKGINGDYNNVVGLPIAKLYRAIRDLQK